MRGARHILSLLLPSAVFNNIDLLSLGSWSFSRTTRKEACGASEAACSRTVESFYPPVLNQTAWITNTSLGTYGGIYQAPADQPSHSVPYGVYDYCSMPHPREEEYELPAAVRNGSVKADLVYLEYLQRHQRRTPYNIFPGGENKEYHCDDILPYLYAGTAQGQTPMQVYAQTYTDPSNPFLKHYVNGTCQYPQLTIGGLLDAFQHGRDLWRVYGDKVQLLPKTPDPERVWFRSSSSALTQDSAGGVLQGIWPDYRGAVPLHQQATGVDTVNAGYPCPARARLLSAIQSTEDWNRHLAVTESLRSELGVMFGASDASWQSTFDHFADNFQARLCNGYDLPCSRTDPSKCVTTEQSDEVFRAGDWEWNYWWRTNANATQYIQLTKGLFIGEILHRLKQIADGFSRLVYSHNFIHDGDIGPVLGALGINALRWPGMGSNIAFEMWKIRGNDEHFIRVLYSGHSVQTVNGILDWISLSDLMTILTPFVPDHIVTLCDA